jgi:hypothetical protein
MQERSLSMMLLRSKFAGQAQAKASMTKNLAQLISQRHRAAAAPYFDLRNCELVY